MVSPATIEWLPNSISSPTREVVWLGGSYHIITLDNEREIVIKESLEFIQESFFKREAIIEYSKNARELVIRNRLIE